MRPHGTATELERRRLLAVDRVRSGYTHQEVADFLGVCRTSVTRWMAAYRKHGRRGLKAKPHPGRTPRLTPDPRQYVNNERAAAFLRYVLRHLRGNVIVVWDGGTMHKGGPIANVLRDYRRLSLEKLPPYAPELNPVEFLWNHLKCGVLANFVPDDVFQLDAVLQKHLKRAKRSSVRLHSFCEACKLPFY